MKRPKVDYDRLASSYDQRFEHDPSTDIVTALRELVQNIRAQQTLEVGCGTGRFLASIHSLTNSAHGLDLSSGMLYQAHRHEALFHLVQGCAGSLPYSPGSFDLIYCVNAIHHFDHPQQFINNAFDALKPGGTIAIFGSDPHAGGHHWYVYEYFDGVLEMDLARFIPHPQIMRWMENAGLQDLQRRDIHHIHEAYQGAAVLEDPFLRQEATSQLALLNQEAYQAGLDRLRSEIEQDESRGQETVFSTDITIALVSGQKVA